MLKVDFGRSAISYVLDLIRVDGLSSEVADLSICGAIPPYNEILCGKLTCLISGSQEIQDMYKRRYGNTISEISTFTAGKAIFRDVNLKVLTTTSLYGRSSQYNRIKILKNKENSLINDLIWNHLGSTRGYGVFHFDEKTTELLQTVYEIKNGYRNVNSVFGEGTSPKLRKIRDGLSIFKIDGETGIKHGQVRDSYATELFKFAREELIFKRLSNSSNSKDSIYKITDCWIKRWLVKRIENEEVMQRLKYSGKSNIGSIILI